MTGDIRQARDDIAAFAQVVGYPLLPYQVDALRLSSKTTVLVAPRQTGKSYSLSLLALWWAFRKPEQTVMLVSAGEEASKRLLSTITSVATHPLLQGSVLNETASLLLLSNGSEIRSVPASERQIRGWSVDLLVVDEAAYVSDEVLLGAAFPTTLARPDSRIVLASTPWAMEGAFYRYALQGFEEGQQARTFQWRLKDAPWIDDATVEHARKTYPALRFQAEFEGEFVGATDALFSPAELRAAVAPYRLLSPEDARGEEIVVGVDWGRAFDRHAVVALGVLEDYGANEAPVLFLPWLETSQRPYTEMVATVAALAQHKRRLTFREPFYSRPLVEKMGGGLTLHESGATVFTKEQQEARRRGYLVRSLVTEMNGVGAMPTEELVRRLGRRVVGVHSSQRSKEDAFSRLRALLSDHRIALPDDLELLRQLQGLTYSPTASGGMSIAAADPNVHDDLADALALAVSAVPADALGGRTKDEPQAIDWLETEGGIRIPSCPRPKAAGSLARPGRIVTW